MSFFNRNPLTQSFMLAASLATLFPQPAAADNNHLSSKDTAIVVLGVLGMVAICVLPDLLCACCSREDSNGESDSLIRAEEGRAGGPAPTN